MPGNRDATVFIGNLDERVSDRVLYEILIQAGRVVDLHIPRDKDSNRHKGIAFAEYETEEIANYAVRLFSGLVTIYNRTLKFAISGQDKAAQNLSTVNLSLKPNLQSEQLSNNEVSQFASRFSAYPPIPSYAQQEPPPPGIIQGNASISDPNGKNYYRHRTLGTSWDNNGHSNSSRKIRNAALMAKGRLVIAAFM